MDTKQRYKVIQIAEILQLSRAKVHLLIAEGRIKAVKLDPLKRTSPYYISEQALNDFKETLSEVH